MDGFYLLLGHMLGDYIFQTDWQANNKTNPHPGPRPKESDLFGHIDVIKWGEARRGWLRGHLACATHCTLYTLAVWAMSWHWMPWWGPLVCWGAHFPLDRFRLARVWMERVAGQKGFANLPGFPVGVILVDNTFHLLTLGLIAALAR